MDLKKSFRYVNVNKYEDNIGVENCIDKYVYTCTRTLRQAQNVQLQNRKNM